MKEFFRILFLCAVALLGACTEDIQNEYEEYDPTAPVGFVTTTASGAATRGTPIDDVSDMTSMGVFASYTGTSDWSNTDKPGKMFNQRLNYSSGAWSYPAGQEVYWGAATLVDRYSFFAYAPYGTNVYDKDTNTTGNGITVSSSAATAGTPTLTYAVPVKVENQPDLMVATKKNVRPVVKTVSLAMKHALTSVAFQIKGNGEKVKGIAIQGVRMSGTLAVDGDNITWSSLGAPTTTDFSASLNYDAGKTYYTTSSTISTNLIASAGYLMMIPQTLTAAAKAIITFDDDTTQEVALGTDTWEAGDKVTYNITLTLEGGQADILYFDANNRLSVGRWGAEVTDIEDMVFTQFGSVIGFTNGAAWNNTTSILFNPTATASYAYGSIPTYNVWNSTTPASSPLVSDPAYHNDANLTAGRGDICKLAGLTSTQAQAMATAGTLDTYQSGWRLPSLQENRAFLGTSPDDATTSFGTSSGYYTWTASTPGTGTFPKNKYQPGVTLPAAGSRGTDGSVTNPGTNGYYWSSTALSNNSGYSMNFTSSLVGPSYSSSYAYGFAVRCISTGETPTPLLSVDPTTVSVTAATSTNNTSTVATNVAGGWTATESTDWIDLTKASGASGEAVTFNVAANPNTTSRTGYITVSAGTATPVTITVTQAAPDLEGGQADILYIDSGGALAIGRWDNSTVTVSNMVFTQFGSVIGFTGVGSWNNTTSIKFNPTATASYSYTAIHNYGKPTTAWAEDDSPLVSDPAYHNDANLLLGRGDICKLVGLTSADAQAMATAGTLDEYQSGWRLPTLEENRMFIGIAADNTTSSFFNTSAYYTWTANGSSASNPGTGTFPKNKYYEEGVNAVTLPAAGNRGVYGLENNPGTTGIYWSSTAYSSSYGHTLHFKSSYVLPSNYTTYAFGFSVRCVK